MLPGLYAHMLNGFLLSVLLIVGLRPIVRDLQLLDMPDFRKVHSGEIPLCGGLAIFTAFMLSSIGFAEDYGIPWNWEVGLGLLVLLGFADDRWRLSAVLRLTVEVLVAGILVAGVGDVILVLGRSLDFGLWYLSAPAATIFAVFFIVGTMNAVNMLDGLDGVAGASMAAAFFWLALIATHFGHGLLALYSLVFIAALLGFLVFNMRHPWRDAANVFLGDAGSLVLGGAVSTFIIHLCTGSGGLSFAALVWVVIVPIADTLSLIVRRLAAGRNPLSPDRWHLHHLLLDIGFSPAMTALIILCATALCGAVAYTGIVLGLPDIYMLLGLSVPLLAHTAFVLSARDHFRTSVPEASVAVQPIGRNGAESFSGNYDRSL